MPIKYRLWEWIAFAVFATFAAYVAVEPVLAAGDCIDPVEIFVFLPYYALLYFGTLPALIGIGIWRAVKGRRMTVQSRRILNVTIGGLCPLLVLEILAAGNWAYASFASRAIDFVPSTILAVWALRLQRKYSSTPGSAASAAARARYTVEDTILQQQTAGRRRA